MTTLHKIGERKAIERLAALLGSREDVRVGIGDDVAVVHIEGSHNDYLLTSDPVIEGVHFLPDAKPERIGHKAVGRCLSDIAAAGGEPLWALINIVAPARTSIERIEAVYRGASALAEKYGLAIIGGDMTAGPALELHVFAIGQVPKQSAILRSGAKPGDLIYVTGALGGSRAGKHLSFEPRIGEGLWLRECRWANAMIDLSDGLASDLRRILEMSRAGAEIDADRIPLSRAAKKARDKRSALDHALFDGEDFELLFTVSPEKRSAFESSWKDTFELECSCIGRITDKAGRLVTIDGKGRRKLLKKSAYEHFV